MTHEEFVRAYKQGAIEVHIDRAAAAQFVSGRTLLPFFVLPLLGLGVAAALAGHVLIGLLVFIAAVAIRFAVRASSQGFLVARSLRDPALFEEVVRKKILVLRAR